MGSLSDVINGADTLEVSAPEKPVQEKPNTEQYDLSSIFSQYKEPAEIKPTTEPAQQTQVQPQSTVATENTKFPGAPAWYGNPLYYQSGKKQGQLKPPPKNGFASAAFQKPVIDVNPTTSILTADQVISGALFLTVINLLIPMAFALINNLVVKGDKAKIIDWEMLQIDSKATKDMEVLADKALKHIKIDANPVGIFLFALLGLYGMQFMTVKLLVDSQAKIKKP